MTATLTTPVSGPTLPNPAIPLPADYAAAMTVLFNDCDGLSHAMAKTLAYSAANPVQGGVTPQFSLGATTALASGSVPAVTLGGSAANPTLAFALPVGAPGTPGTPGQNGAPGTLGSGAVSTNTAAATSYGVQRQIANWLADRVTTTAFGSTNGDGTMANASFNANGGGGIGATTRADMVAYTVAGKQPYYFMAAQPMSAGGSSLVYNPLAVAPPSSGTTSTFSTSASYTSTGVSVQQTDGTYYVPMGQNMALNTVAGHVATWSGGPSAGVPVQSTHGSGIVFASLPSTIASGTVINLGIDPALLVVGNGWWTPTGISTSAPTLITAVSGRTVTISPAVVSTTLPQGGTQSGMTTMQEVVIYPPMAESTLAANTTMDFLAFHAAYYSRDQVFYANVGTQYPTINLEVIGHLMMQPGAIVGGRPVNITGQGRVPSLLLGTKSDPVFRVFPAIGAYQEIRDLSVSYTSGYADSAFYVSGHGFNAFSQNLNTDAALRIHNVNVTLHGSAGARACIVLRNLGNVSVSEVELSGPGKTVAGSCGIDAGHLILLKTHDLNIHYVKTAVLQSLYIEHPILDKLSTDQCGATFDNATSSTLNGLRCLLFNATNLDTDCSNFVIRLSSTSGATFGPSNMGGGSLAGPVLILMGCNTSTIIGVNGQGANGFPYIQLLEGAVDGGSYACSGISGGVITVDGKQGCTYAVDMSGRHAAVEMSARLVIAPNGANQFSSTPIKYTAGSGNIVNGAVV